MSDKSRQLRDRERQTGSKWGDGNYLSDAVEMDPGVMAEHRQSLQWQNVMKVSELVVNVKGKCFYSIHVGTENPCPKDIDLLEALHLRGDQKSKITSNTGNLKELGEFNPEKKCLGSPETVL